MQHPNLFLDGVTAEHYREAIADLERGLAQLQAIDRGEGWSDGCTICGDTDHHAGMCWYHNPLLLSVLGREALLGDVWRCFHCFAVFTDEESARQHFGDSQDEVVECLRQLTEVDG